MLPPTISEVEIIWTFLAAACLVIVLARTLRRALMRRQAVIDTPADQLPLARTLDPTSHADLKKITMLDANDRVRRQAERSLLLVVFIAIGAYAMTRLPPVGGGQAVSATIFIAGEVVIVINALLDEIHQTRIARTSARLKPRASDRYREALRWP